MDVSEMERELLRDRDLGDLCDCVQLLRSLAWNTLPMKIPARVMFVWHEDIDAFEPAIAALNEIAAGGGEQAGVAATLAGLYALVRDALIAGPRRPTEREVVLRYARGEIGDRTAQAVLDVDSRGLIELCQRYGLPPLHGAIDD